MLVEVVSFAAANASMLILVSAYLYFYLSSRDRSLLLWFVGWGLQFLRLALALAEATILPAADITVAIQLVNLASTYFILAGTLAFTGARMPGYGPVLLGLVAAWMIVTWVVQMPFWAVTLPAWTVTGAVFIYLSTQIFRVPYRRFGGTVASIGLFVWGLHKLNYPFLRTVEWFAPLGFRISAFLAVFVGLTLLMSYLDRVQRETAAGENRFRALVASLEDIVITASPGGVVQHVYGGWYEHNNMPESSLRGRSVTDVLNHRHDAVVNEAIAHVLTGDTRNLTLDLTLHDSTRWFAFTVSPLRDADGMVAGVVAVGRDVTESVETRNALATRLRENETLLQEIHHRVKNNMQVMASLLNLQLARLHDSRDKKLVQESSRRIETMARVHEQLYASRDLARVDMQPYVTELVERLVRTYGSEEQEVRAHTDVDDIRLSIERAVPCAQILHEVITNALKHGLRERESGNLTVAFKYASDNSLVLSVHDDGDGFTSEHMPTSDSLGLKLIELLSRQLDGAHAFTNHLGTTFELRLPVEPCRG